MLRITWDHKASPPTLSLHGRLAGAWVDELERVWREVKSNGSRPLVDLTDMTYMDRAGRQLLGEMVRGGAELRGTPLMQFTIDAIRQESKSGENAKGGGR